MSGGLLGLIGTDMELQEVRSAFKLLERLQFPPPPNDLELGDWIMDLLELDGFYAGVATSLLAGNAPSHRPEKHELEDLKTSLENLRVIGEEDILILAQCRNYFQALARLHNALIGFFDGGKPGRGVD